MDSIKHIIYLPIFPIAQYNLKDMFEQLWDVVFYMLFVEYLEERYFYNEHEYLNYTL